MKFSNDAMRDTLLFLEENISYEKRGMSDKRVKRPFNLNNVVVRYIRISLKGVLSFSSGLDRRMSDTFPPSP